MALGDKLLQKKGADPLCGVQDLVRGGGHSGAAVDLGDQLEQERCVFPHARDLFQVLRRGVQHFVQAAEPLHQGVGDRIGILPGNGIEE